MIREALGLGRGTGRVTALLARHIISQPPAGFTQLTDEELAALTGMLGRLGEEPEPRPA